MSTAPSTLPWLRRRRQPGIPSGDLADLRATGRRAWLVRIVLGIGLLSLFTVSVLLARGLDAHSTALLPAGSSGVVVLDLSRSIDEGSLRRIGGVLDKLVAADVQVGLVVFSDVAYELLPPGTPSRALQPMLRYFTPTGGRFLANPWSDAFRGGTRISRGLQLARSMLARAGVDRGSILLVSDLETGEKDQATLADQLIGLRSGPIQLKVVPLAPIKAERAFFERILGQGAFVASSDAIFGRRSPLAGFANIARTPVWLLVSGGALLLLLTLNELWGGRLELPRRHSR
jgi:VWA domain-containing protein